MRNLDSLSAEKLLSVGSAEALFSRFPQDARQEYRALALRWHPDRLKTNEASSVFTHIAQLYREAQSKQQEGNWNEPCEKIEEEVPGIKKFLTSGNHLVKAIECLSLRQFELGTMYIGNHCVTFEVKNEFSDLFHNARRRMRNLRFKNEAMAVEMSKFLPQIEDQFQTDSANFLRIRKTPDQLLLADVLEHYSTRIEPVEHIGWILNVLLNISCYLEWSGLTHNAISPDTFFISPLRHSGMLLGGWWYATPVGDKLKAIPDRSRNFIPPDIIMNRQADLRADLELIKTIGREILGDQIGISLKFEATLPERLVSWLLMPSNQRSVDEYKTWKYEVLEECFGKAQFIPMNLESKDLYKEI